MSREFTVSDTHGFSRLPSFSVQSTSVGLGWTKSFLSTQVETPFSHRFTPIADILVSVIRTGSSRAEVTLNASRHSMEAAPGGVTIIPDRVDFKADTQSRFETTHLYLRRSVINDIAADMLRADPQNIEILPSFGTFDPVLEHLVRAIQDAMDDQREHSPLYVEYLGNAIAARLIQNHSNAAGVRTLELPRERLSGKAIERIRSLIEQRLKTRLTADDLVEGTGMSTDHFGRLFKQTMGTTLHQFVIRCRVDRARTLLANTKIPLVQVAFECGFADQVHLTRVFSKVVGVTPGAYRKDKGR
ncbi:AraC family transcriptional regulator [Rhizobium sp. PP-CC-3A-592]|nr:AraC family transcriptional regulator [Rhizobium sp. PP-CC-3A-592]